MDVAHKRESWDTRPETTKEEERTLRKPWTEDWLRNQSEILKDRQYRWMFEHRPARRFRITIKEALLKPVDPSLPKRNSMNVRERAAAIIREELYFYPPVMEQIIQGIDHFESWNRDTAREYINRAQKEIDEEWKKADEWEAEVELARKNKVEKHPFREAWDDLFLLCRAGSEKLKRMPGDVRTFKFLFEKKRREEYVQSMAWFLKAKRDAIVRTFEFLWMKGGEQKAWEEMSWLERWMVTINGPCGGTQVPWTRHVEKK
ncbi:hypothetical protein SBOR_5847 [Sclerotinia borealis F-4128]|uniref:Uncharacterized protein n=1 Tax=Sclerotinia borealis (strain F-4128) TaxID=1432307 RepID=W9CG72_SCLBF|nr:hypothetical protein SBOR_5847 [Sclerotinia borealis F-4128]